MIASEKERMKTSLRRHAVLGIAVILAAFGGVISWAMTTSIANAVIGSGTVVIEGKSKKVQHPAGGIVSEILTKEGEFVEAGDILIRLDSTVARANLAVISARVNQFYARQSRLEAEQLSLDEVKIPTELLFRLGEVEAAKVMSSERLLFNRRRSFNAGKKKQLVEQAAQLRKRIVGYQKLQEAVATEVDLIEAELEGLYSLFDKGLARLNQITNLKRDSANLLGDQGQLLANIAQTQGRISEINVQLLQVDQEFQREVAAELRDVSNRIGEFLEQEVAALDQLKRLNIIAPISGHVFNMQVHTVGGVIGEADELMFIVPQPDQLLVEAKVLPKDIDQLEIGLKATLRLTAFNRNTTPELSGIVKRISADLIVDEATGVSFYRIGISIPPSETLKISDLVLLPGMPVEAFIHAGERLVISYLLKPIKDHAWRAFKEE